MKVVFFSLSLFISMLLFGNCSFVNPIIKEQGEIIKQSRNVKDFSEIKFAIPGELVLTQSDSFSLTIEATENIIENIETVVIDNQLVVKSNKNLRTKKPIKIYLSAPNLELINLAGSGDIYQNTNWKFTNLNLIVSGSGNITLKNTVIEGDLKNIIRGSGNIYLTETSKIINLNNVIHGSGDITISSNTTCKTDTISIYGSGNVTSINTPTEKCVVEIKGSGTTRINVKSKLEAVITGSGDVHFKGNPEIYSNIKGSGEVNRIK